MATPRVVPALDVSKQRELGFGLGFEAASIDQLALEAREEALRHRVVVGVAHTAHRGLHAHRTTSLTEGDTGVLRTLVAVMNDVGGLAL